jgi:hypothetical protein
MRQRQFGHLEAGSGGMMEAFRKEGFNPYPMQAES